MAGRNVMVGKDHTLFATKEGVVSFGKTRKTNYDGTKTIKKVVHID
jgi:ribosomal protein L27